jgi:hypothetical protein
MKFSKVLKFYENMEFKKKKWNYKKFLKFSNFLKKFELKFVFFIL